MRVLDLFSGIGGFSLGLERAGMTTAAFCEINPFCQRVLAKHWPETPCYDDIATLTGARLAADGIVPELICGGFPCQDLSFAGRGAGLAGERSGLWSEYRRLIDEVRPSWVIIENVSALRSRGLDAVLGSLAAIGYDAEWHCIPASAVGAHHRRDRIWIVAYPDYWPEHAVAVDAEMEIASELVADPIGAGLERGPRLAGYLADELAAIEQGGAGACLGDAASARCAQPIGSGEALSGTGPREPAGPDGGERNQWLVEPDVGRVANGVPSRVDRLKSLGNAVVPQIPEAIGRAILAYQLEQLTD